MDKKDLVVKNNELNQYTFYKSSVQLKVFSKLIVEIRKNPNKEKYELRIQDLLEDFDGSKKNYERLKEICKRMNQMIEIPKEKGFSLKALFYEIETEEKGFIEFEVNPKLKPYIIELSNHFTSYHLKNIMRLKSSYSIRIYELLKQYQGKDKGGWWKVNIEDLKDILKIDKKKYTLYANFKNKVILVAQRELKKTTDIAFDFEEHKRGKKVETITFHIKDNNKKQEVLQIEEPKEEIHEEKEELNYSIATTQLMHYGIQPKQAFQYYEQKGEEFLLSIFHKWKKSLESGIAPDGKEIVSYAGFLDWAIKNDQIESEHEKGKREEREKEEQLKKEELKRRDEEMQKEIKAREEKEKKQEEEREQYKNTSAQEITEWIIQELQNKSNSYNSLSQQAKEKIKKEIFDEKEKCLSKKILLGYAMAWCVQAKNYEDTIKEEEKQGIKRIKPIVGDNQKKKGLFNNLFNNN